MVLYFSYFGKVIIFWVSGNTIAICNGSQSVAMKNLPDISILTCKHFLSLQYGHQLRLILSTIHIPVPPVMWKYNFKNETYLSSSISSYYTQGNWNELSYAMTNDCCFMHSGVNKNGQFFSNDPLIDPIAVVGRGINKYKFIKFTCARVHHIFANTALEKTGTTIAAENTIVLTKRFVSTYTTVHCCTEISTFKKILD